MEQDVFIATVAGLLHDLRKLKAWAGEEGAGAAQALPDEILRPLVGALGGELAEHINECAKALAAQHGDTAAQGTPALLPVASRISLGSNSSGNGKDAPRQGGGYYFIPHDLLEGKLEKVLFPTERGPTPKDYRTVWKELVCALNELASAWQQAGLDALKHTAQRQIIHDLLGLLHRFASFVPAYGPAAGSESGCAACDIPLYEHLCATAAVEAAKAAAGGDKLLLVIGDISGIQGFIYRLQRRGNETQVHLAKRLRGRSFYLAAFSRALAMWIADRCGVSEANIIIAAGGNFQVLVPGTQDGQETEQILEQCRREMNRWMLEQFRGRIAVALDWQELEAGDLARPHEVVQKVINKLAERKLRKFSELDSADFQGLAAKRITRECDSCGIGLADGEGVAEEKEEPLAPGEEARVRVLVCDTCFSAFCTGNALPRSRLVAWWIGRCYEGDDGEKRQIAPTPVSGVIGCPHPDFEREEPTMKFGPAGCAWLLDNKANLQELRRAGFVVDALLRSDAKERGTAWWPVATHVATVGDPVKLKAALAGELGKRMGPSAVRELTEQLERHGGQKAEGDILPFELLAALSRGDSLIGVLRMDADSMGSVFSQGLRDLAWTSQAHGLDPLARFMAFSRQLDEFFCGWLDEFLRERFAKAKERAEQAAACGEEGAEQAAEQQGQDQDGRVDEDQAGKQPRYDPDAAEPNPRLCDPNVREAIDGWFYVAYAGGDDLFLVGPWSEMIRVAADINEQFDRYVCHNPDLTVSAGLLISKPKAPIYMLADRAGELEHRSKGEGRDRITAFGVTVPWDGGLDDVNYRAAREFGYVLAAAVEGRFAPQGKKVRRLPRGFLHLLLRLRDRFVDELRDEECVDINMFYVPLLVWYMARTVAKQEIHVSDSMKLDDYLRERLLTGPTKPEQHWLAHIKLPVSIALSLTRQ